MTHAVAAQSLSTTERAKLNFQENKGKIGLLVAGGAIAATALIAAAVFLACTAAPMTSTLLLAASMAITAGAVGVGASIYGVGKTLNKARFQPVQPSLGQRIKNAVSNKVASIKAFAARHPTATKVAKITVAAAATGAVVYGGVKAAGLVKNFLDQRAADEAAKKAQEASDSNWAIGGGIGAIVGGTVAGSLTAFGLGKASTFLQGKGFNKTAAVVGHKATKAIAGTVVGLAVAGPTAIYTGAFAAARKAVGL